ncbi:MAG: hypothetical protein MJK18_02090, partial [Bdellovibrionales bacterium]|nr:hypothetical protein [Bdellovibrionales bacterium]
YKKIKELKSVSLTSVTLHFESDNDNCQGFGCLFPREENFHSLGVLFNHHIFENRAEKGMLSETWIFNDERKSISQLEENDLISLILEDRKRLRSIDETPSRQFVHQWNKRIPLYNNELEEVLDHGLRGEKNLFIFGNYLGSLGLSKILVAAKKISQQVIEEGQWKK